MKKKLKSSKIQSMNTEKENLDVIKRMNRILGQVQGVKKMLEEHRSCMEILSQITAIKSALDGVAMIVLENEATRCFETTLDKNPSREQALKDFISLIRKYTK